MDWVEERCEAIRMALSITGFPSEPDLYRLVEWLAGPVEVKHERVELASYWRARDGRAVIVLPERESGRALDMNLVHELGHALLGAGMGPLLRQLSPGERGAARLARVWDMQDERRAEDFMLAWFLPSGLLALRDDDRVQWESGCDLELIARRRSRLRGRVHTLRSVPDWAAWWCFHVIQAEGQPTVYVAPRGSMVPEFWFPLGAEPADKLAARLNAELVALTSDEFAAKHAAIRLLRAAPTRPSLDELRAML